MLLIGCGLRVSVDVVAALPLGEDEAGLEAGAATVIEAAQRFRVAAGGYRLVNVFRLAVGRTPAGGTLAG
ncbi:hypothetical protein [Glaciibacter sp. 2TAF33]|uniref:hypothetical protein n=1 Tax=Glaciibacter sp. 2TAF33 TaxID=3233015 RepID=UPI003F8F6F3C